MGGWEVAPVSCKWLKVPPLQMKVRESQTKHPQWESPMPTFTGNDPCVNTFGHHYQLVLFLAPQDPPEVWCDVIQCVSELWFSDLTDVTLVSEDEDDDDEEDD